MSRIGKKSITVPAGVEIKINGREVAVKGPKGELKRELSQFLSIEVKDGLAYVSVKEESGIKRREASQFWGLGRALLATMIKGVTEGFERALEFSGVGYKAQVKGKDLELNLGYTHPITINAPEGISFQVEKNTIKVMGVDKETVGHIAAQIRESRLPEPYKGTGVKYKEEIIIRKAGKKAVATG